jgi:RNA-directed DNA polymerase
MPEEGRAHVAQQLLQQKRKTGMRYKGIHKSVRPETKDIRQEANNKVRTLGIPAIRDRVVQGALRLILELIFEADFKDGSYGYRPKRSPHRLQCSG